MTVKIACMSDIHGKWRQVQNWPKADILAIAGDILPNYYSGRGCEPELINQLAAWADLNRFAAHSLPYKEVIAVAGNHDWVAQKEPELFKRFSYYIKYLQDEPMDIMGLKFYGSPWQPYFYGWAFNFPNPNSPLFEYDSQAVADKYAIETWSKIPLDTDVLITHGPPLGILDNCQDGRSVGCPHLMNRLQDLNNLKLHIFGHIHHSKGIKAQQLAKCNPTFVNAATCDEEYHPINPIQVVEI